MDRVLNHKKIVVGAVVVILVIAGGIFLIQPVEPEPREGEFNPEPTQWSQKEDYEVGINERGVTLVRDTKAGLAFEVPKGWSAEYSAVLSDGGTVTGTNVALTDNLYGLYIKSGGCPTITDLVITPASGGAELHPSSVSCAI